MPAVVIVDHHLDTYINVAHDLNNNKIFKILSANESVLRNYTYLKPHCNILSILDNNIGNILPMRGYVSINTTCVYNNMYTLNNIITNTVRPCSSVSMCLYFRVHGK